MTKEQAKALGLDDAAAEKVAAESAKELKEYVKKSDYDTLTAEKAQLEKDVKTRDGQIEQLKKADPEKLQQTIDKLQEDNTNNKAHYISIHALCVEGDAGQQHAEKVFGISIHALRVEGDCYARCNADGALISIHTLRVEGDL